jgi:dTDP-4-amino-4,6-dideoxygalactose transaminase
MMGIRRLADSYGFSIIEDAAHAIGAWYAGDPVGSCRYSDITVFSFHPVKIVTSAEGGMAVTNDAGLAEKLDLLRNHGITRNPSRMTEAAHGPWYYQQIELGFNYRMTDLQAALGASQMTRLDEFVGRRHEIFLAYNEAFSSLPLLLPVERPDSISSHHLYVVRLCVQDASKRRLQLFNELRAAGVGVNVHYIPVHLQPWYSQFGFRAGDFPAAEAFYEQAITLPLFPSMTTAQQHEVIHAVREALS